MDSGSAENLTIGSPQAEPDIQTSVQPSLVPASGARLGAQDNALHTVPDTASIHELKSSPAGSERSRQGTARPPRPLNERELDSKSVLDDTRSRPQTALSIKDKIGVWGIVFLSVGYILPLASLGFLGFLWFANQTDNLWRRIASDNWMPRAIAICAEVIKQPISFSTGTLVAMMAALVLEQFDVVLPNAASVSLMRATASSGSSLLLLWHQLVTMVATRFKNSWPTLLLVFLLSCVYGLTQAVSILLLSDLGLATIPGDGASNAAIPIPITLSDTDSIGHSPPWHRPPAFFPIFAEYSEPPYESVGVRDTGLTLRAFLPLPNPRDRESLFEYIGPTTVIDARVTCQVPRLADTIVSRSGDNVLRVDGRVAASRHTPRLADDVSPLDANRSIPFSCQFGMGEIGLGGKSGDEWRTAICQLPSQEGFDFLPVSKGLVSEFEDIGSSPENVSAGIAYLITNITLGSPEFWKVIMGGNDNVFSPPAFSDRSEWIDLIFSNGDAVLSLTLCHSAFRQAEMPVHLSSASNRTEIVPLFNFSNSRYDFSAVRNQMGQGRRQTDQRKLLRMHSKSWVQETGLSYIRNGLDMSKGVSEYRRSPFENANITGIMYNVGGAAVNKSDYILPDIMHVWLFQEIVANGGSVAFALQAILTVLSSMTYYDNIQNFDRMEPVKQIFFMVTTVPMEWKGFAAVAATIALHLALMTVITRRFVQGTAFSRLGSCWLVLAQTVHGGASTYVDGAELMSDGDVEKIMKEDGVKKERAGIRRGEAITGISMK
ncbi:hypothetical protein B0T25DRAFT_546166 [Lasiosphaeria hispida]|uniref:Uncharacterized protein n=1 Tax=Lasiosphaeria hispida TaxID=260671 RepID=A0AAJ0HD64_9PEZI|nr:hypothetical protein B0T25DRAFT_546166 [Lasiosphaeria hispida]